MEKKNNIEALILAGGFGSRLEEITKTIPKPLVKIGSKPIILHIMRQYIKHGVKTFYVALGYKGNELIKYFTKKKIELKFNTKLVTNYKILNKSCKIIFINTGLNSMTGGRLKLASKFIEGKNFFFTYGDGISNVNLTKLKKYHFKKKKLITMTVVNPPPRFGLVKIKGNIGIKFNEKSKIKSAWINGGFFTVNKKFIKLIKNHKSILEEYPLESASKKKELLVFKHSGFWQCMDTKRDKDILNKIYKSRNLIKKYNLN